MMNLRVASVVVCVGMVVVGSLSAPAARAGGVLYAPSAPDNPSFRAALSALLGGASVDYWDAYSSIPPVSVMAQYDVVFTWVNYPLADPVLMGDRLADYADQGGRAILGQWCYPTGQGNYLQGRIMTAAYCPAVIGSGGGAYNHDGTDCVHFGVTTYNSYQVVEALQPGAQCDGTVGSEGKSAVAWRGDRGVYYSGAYDTYGTGSYLELIANMCWCSPPPIGACCNLQTGVCVDTGPMACDDTFYAMICAELDPPCGDPGACCDDSSGVCVDGVLAYDCSERAVSGTLCADITPPCGGMSVLYAPSNADNPTFRSALAALLGGPVDYFNAYTSPTPTLDFLLQYDCVFTWANYPYYDRVAFGDVLADYVDAGGRVILGQWAWSGLVGWPSGGEFYGRILYPEYCPAAYISTSFGSGSYAGDGTDCVSAEVYGYQGDYLDVIGTLSPGALSDGTFEPYDSPAVTWRPDRRVYYSPGNTGGSYGTGDWALLTANMCTCQAPHTTGDLNCDGAVNAFDIDPFVLALTDPAAYAAQFAYCDYMLADCNGDGAVNAFDIDPFVALLTGAP